MTGVRVRVGNHPHGIQPPSNDLCDLTRVFEPTYKMACMHTFLSHVLRGSVAREVEQTPSQNSHTLVERFQGLCDWC